MFRLAPLAPGQLDHELEEEADRAGLHLLDIAARQQLENAGQSGAQFPGCAQQAPFISFRAADTVASVEDPAGAAEFPDAIRPAITELPGLELSGSESARVRRQAGKSGQKARRLSARAASTADSGRR